MKKQTLKEMWVCKSEDLLPNFRTIALTEEVSIQKLLDMGYAYDNWEHYKSLGWECFEVDITFEPCSPETP